MVILIPARDGSKRIPGKALKELGGKPLLAWTIESALNVGGAIRVVVASEDIDILLVARGYHGCETWRRPLSTASDDAPDITWLSLALDEFPDQTLFMVRRPTSPFITPATMERAWSDLEQVRDATALRAMRPVREHPMKMWQRSGPWVSPLHLVPWQPVPILNVEPWSTPTQLLPKLYVQTAGLEMIRRSTLEQGSLTGDRLLPLFLEGKEAIDLNTPEDWAKAEAYVDSGD